MSRGEAGKGTSRSRGIAIGVSFALLCLGALVLVLRTTHTIENFRSPWGWTPPREPVVGVFAALRSVSGVCPGQSAGPTLPGAPDPPSDLATRLGELGLVELPEAAETLSLPWAANRSLLDGACGLALINADPGSRLFADPSRRYRMLAVVSVCDAGASLSSGAGTARARYFALPGLSADARAATGLSGPSLLRMAIAEAALSRRGFVPGRRYAVETVAPATAGATHVLSPPATPSSGCVAWVAVGEGLSDANSSFEGQPTGSSCAEGGLEEPGFVVALLSCASTGAGIGTGEVSFFDPDGDGGRVYFRPFGISSVGPRLQTSAPATTVGGLREISGGSIPLPTPALRREP
ncbi:MAG: hypothetical protein GXP55_24860 [Deltaproteobacteria bacterium]|nr:hypothetical protein [Deltaproteobacteria bacterium]